LGLRAKGLGLRVHSFYPDLQKGSLVSCVRASEGASDRFVCRGDTIEFIPHVRTCLCGAGIFRMWRKDMHAFVAQVAFHTLALSNTLHTHTHTHTHCMAQVVIERLRSRRSLSRDQRNKLKKSILQLLPASSAPGALIIECNVTCDMQVMWDMQVQCRL
jgi:hypothetical protein